jgi:hypothetical protein
MREDKVNYLLLILISIVYMILPVKNLARITSALKPVGSFSASTETSGFSLKSQTRVNTCFVPSYYV